MYTHSRTRTILNTLDNLGANIFFRLPLYLGHCKTAYVIDDVGIWLFCKPLGFLDSSIRTTRRRFRSRKKRRTNKDDRPASDTTSVLYNEKWSSGSYETCSTGSYDYDTLSSGSRTAKDGLVLEREGEKHNEINNADNLVNHDFDTKTFSSNSWSKWSESVIDGSTWLKSVTTIWGYGSGYGSSGRKKRRRKRSRQGIRRGRWGWKSQLSSLWAKLNAYYD